MYAMYDIRQAQGGPLEVGWILDIYTFMCIGMSCIVPGIIIPGIW